MQLWVDMDGVLADFDAHHEKLFGVRSDKLLDNVDWTKVHALGNFYATMPPMADLPELLSHIRRHHPIVLTGIPENVDAAQNDKVRWGERWLGDIPVFCCRSKDKCKYALPGDILIDDWEKHRALWLGAGGRWITHRSAADTIAQLKDMGIE